MASVRARTDGADRGSLGRRRHHRRRFRCDAPADAARARRRRASRHRQRRSARSSSRPAACVACALAHATYNLLAVLARSSARPARRSHSTSREALRRTHGARAVDLTVEPGELVALLGPNGAGKTTLVSLVIGLRRPSAGTVRALRRRSARLAGSPHLGTTPQQMDFPPTLRGREILELARTPPRVRRRSHTSSSDSISLRCRPADRLALGRPTAPARARTRVCERADARRPRRADDRPRPRVAPARLGSRSRRFTAHGGTVR